MKNQFAIIILLFVSHLSFGQQNAENALLEKMTSEVCKNIDKANVKSKDDGNELEVKLGVAILPVFQENAEAIKKVFDLNTQKPEDAKKMGEKLGAYAVFKCDKFRELAMLIIEKDKTIADRVSNKLSTNENENGSAINFNGKIDRIENNEFSYIYFSTGDGETIKVIWLENFEGSHLLNDEKYLEKNYTLQYITKSIYQPSIKSYKDMKVITHLSLL